MVSRQRASRHLRCRTCHVLKSQRQQIWESTQDHQKVLRFFMRKPKGSNEVNINSASVVTNFFRIWCSLDRGRDLRCITQLLLWQNYCHFIRHWQQASAMWNTSEDQLQWNCDPKVTHTVPNKVTVFFSDDCSPFLWTVSNSKWGRALRGDMQFNISCSANENSTFSPTYT